MKILTGMVQGDDNWHEARKNKRTASEAAAVFGDHKYMTRNDLLKQKATGLVPEVDAHQQVIFDKGHASEAMARPIAEEITGEELFPCTCVDDAGIYLASMDGLDMLGEIGFEHKSLNDKLRTATAETLEDHYKWQMDHQMMVTGAEEILFMASDGTKENCVWFWYERDEKRIERLIAAWEQFVKDLAEYIPPEAEEPKAEGKAPESLPALVVRASGMVEASNLKEFEAIARATLAGINTDLQTDNDFADAEKAVKFCADVEKRLDGARENVLGQMQTVDEVVRSIDAIKEETRQVRLKLSSAVKSQKESRKLEILTTARAAYHQFYGALESALEVEAGGIAITLSNNGSPDFGGAMKGKRTISSLRDACDDLTAQSKISANEVAAVIRGNLQQLSEDAEDYRFLFNDFGQLCQKPADDFAAIVKSRIADHKQAEHDRMEAERAKIRAEEEVKARREAEATAQKEADERQWVAEQEALKQKQAEQANRQVAESETAKVEQASREQHGEGEKVANQPVAPAKPQAVSRPSDNEIALAIAIHFNVSQATAWIWITEIKTQETA
jgi:putative phage-type endonuclease